MGPTMLFPPATTVILKQGMIDDITQSIMAANTHWPMATTNLFCHISL